MDETQSLAVVTGDVGRSVCNMVLPGWSLKSSDATTLTAIANEANKEDPEEDLEEGNDRLFI